MSAANVSDEGASLRRVVQRRTSRLTRTLLSGVGAFALALPVRAESPIAVSGSTCNDGAARVSRHLAEIAERHPSPDLSAAVTFDSFGDGVRVHVALRERSVARGETVLVVADCSEAVDAAVVVLSLAFSAEVNDVPNTDSLREAPAVIDAPEPDERMPLRDDTARPLFRAPLSPLRDAAPAHAGDRITPRAARVSASGGVDLGTLPSAAAFVGGGVAYAWPALEVRGSLRYGLPTADERVETGLRETVRRDFGGFGLGVCRGAGTAMRLTLCAGGELDLVRIERRLAVDGRATLDEDELLPRFSGVLSALLSLHPGRIRPELEISGSALAFGGAEGASRVAFRAGAGAAVDF